MIPRRNRDHRSAEAPYATQVQCRRPQAPPRTLEPLRAPPLTPAPPKPRILTKRRQSRNPSDRTRHTVTCQKSHLTPHQNVCHVRRSCVKTSPVTPTAHIMHTRRNGRSAALFGRFKDRDALHMMRHRKHVPFCTAEEPAGQKGFLRPAPSSAGSGASNERHANLPHCLDSEGLPQAKQCETDSPDSVHSVSPPDPERPHRPSGTPPSPVSKPAGSSSRPAPGSRQVSARQVSDTGGPESTSRKKRVRVLDSPTMPPLIHSATPLPVGSLDEKRVCMDSRNTWPASGVHRGITSGAWPIPRCGTGRFIRLRIRRQERGRSCRSRNWSLSLYC